MFLRHVALFGLVTVVLAGCGSGGNKPGTGAAGTTGSAGATGSGGTTSPAGGTTGSTGGSTDAGGTTGSTGGSTGSTGGSTGSTGGSTGSTGGSTGSTGGSTGGGGIKGTAGATATGGTGGTVAAGGTTGAGGRASGPSAACNQAPPNEAIGTAVLHTIDITGMSAQYVAGYTHRKYCTTIPKNYDPTKPYPVVFYGPGCGATSCEGSSFSGRADIFLVQGIAQSSADLAGNIVPKNGSPGCFQAGKESNADSPEGPYFDQVMNQVESKYCTDKGRIFAAGTSSGSWLSDYLACARGNRIRGTAADSGGIQFDHGTCTGGAGVMLMPGDSTNATDQEGHQIGAAVARDLFIQLNGCSTTPTTMTFGSDSCQLYGNCASPVVWCNVGGSHQSGNGHLSPTGWAFWSTLK
jgi:poly(3-hydroxybutyrate) depolymerase